MKTMKLSEAQFKGRVNLVVKTFFESQGMEPKYLPITFANDQGEHGSFHYRNNESYKLSFNRLLLVGAYDIDEVDETIAHEVVHFLVFEKGHKRETHGKIFQKYFKELLGFEYRGVRRKSRDLDVVVKHSKYAVRCKKCGNVVARSRMSKLITDYMFYTCKCGGHLERLK